MSKLLVGGRCITLAYDYTAKMQRGFIWLMVPVHHGEAGMAEPGSLHWKCMVMLLID